MLSKKLKKKKDLSNIFELIRLKNVKKKLRKFFLLFRSQIRSFPRKRKNR